MTTLPTAVKETRWSFGDDILDLKLPCCHEPLSSVKMVTNVSWPVLLPVMSLVHKLPLELEPVAREKVDP